MKEKIKANLNNPAELEKLFSADKIYFTQSFYALIPEIADIQIAQFWKARLDFEKPQEKPVKLHRLDIIVLVTTCLFTWLLIELPKFFTLYSDEAQFYFKNASLIVFFGLSVYAVWKNSLFNRNNLLYIALTFLIPAIYINLLPAVETSDSLILAYIHLPLMMWCIYGIVFMGFDFKSLPKRMDFIRYNGDLAILLAVILIAGGILSGITIGLFSVIDISIERFYGFYIAPLGLVSAPIVASWIFKNFPSLTNKIAPIIASIFSPLVLITLTIYMISIPFSGKNPYHDREFLLIFNAMLLGVMALIVFGVIETSVRQRQKFSEFVLFFLTIVTLVIDVVALSAIFYRLGQYGFTPNRLAVVVSNLLIFGNLVLIMIDLYKVNFRNADISKCEDTIAKYLPVYAIWTIIVVFGFPLIFSLR